MLTALMCYLVVMGIKLKASFMATAMILDFIVMFTYVIGKGKK